MKKVLSLVLVMVLIIASAGALPSFADGYKPYLFGQVPHFKALSAKMEENEIYAAIMTVEIERSSMFLRVFSHDSEGWCVDVSEHLITKEEFISPRLMEFISLCREIASAARMHKFCFNVMYFKGQKDYRFTYLKMQLKDNEVIFDSRLDGVSFTEITRIISDKLVLIPERLNH